MIVTDQSHVFNCRCILISKVILGLCPCVLFIRPLVVSAELAGVEEIILPDMWVKFKDFVAGIRFGFVICSWICVVFFTT